MAGARSLSDAELATLGGKDAQLLMEVEFVGGSQTYTLLPSTSCQMRMTLFSKTKREVVWHSEVEAKFTTVGYGVVDMVPGARREFAMSAAMVKAFRTLPALPNH